MKYKPSQYKYVSGRSVWGKLRWFYKIDGYTSAGHETERDAAKNADLYLIRHNREPVNVLKRKDNAEL
jgi:hypothetical protein